MRTLLVDDEVSARRRLARLLSAYDDVEVVGEAQDGLQAIDLLESLKPDAVFLDIQMPELDGFGVVRGISSSASIPLIIFATSFDQHALAAFEANAVAYLLKPIEPARLEAAINRVRRLLTSEAERIEDQKRIQAISRVTTKLQRVVARKGHSVVLLDPEDIFWFYIDDGIVKARTASETYWVNYQLAQLEEGLGGHSFFRARREVLINLSRVKLIKPFDRSTFLLTMADVNQTELVVSERQARELRLRLPGL